MGPEAYCDRMRGKLGYSEFPMMPPPSETGINVVQFNLTDGCSHNRCTFCDMYGKKVSYRVKSLGDFKEHVDRVIEYLENDPMLLMEIDRIFVGAGNALGVETELLTVATQYAMEKVYRATYEVPRRLAIYGNTEDIIEKGKHGLAQLRCGGKVCHVDCSKVRLGDRRGVEVVYWGLESGSKEVRKIAGKSGNDDNIGNAVDALNDAGMRVSMMIMPGLGGISYFEDHVSETVRILNATRPEWITFMGLTIRPGTAYERWINNEENKGNNRRLTPKEMIEQTAQIIEGLRFHTYLGLHGNEVTTHNSIPVSFGSASIWGSFEAKALAEELRGMAK